jgi:hypothetical protein
MKNKCTGENCGVCEVARENNKKLYIDAWAVVFKETKQIYTATDGMGIFQERKWAKSLAKVLGEQFVDVLPVSVVYGKLKIK